METCTRTLKNGGQCQNKCFKDSDGFTHALCKLHLSHTQTERLVCGFIQKNGNPCQASALKIGETQYLRCGKHDAQEEEKRLTDYHNRVPSGAALLDM
jgi:hypothetical protein